MLRVLIFALAVQLSPASIRFVEFRGIVVGLNVAVANDGSNSGSGSSDADRSVNGSDNSDSRANDSDKPGYSKQKSANSGDGGANSGGEYEKSDGSKSVGQKRGKPISRIEMSPYSVFIFYADGSRESVENGRYEHVDSARRLIEDRNATAADLSRMRSVANALSVKNVVVPKTSSSASSEIVKIDVSGHDIKVLYVSGWKEEINDGIYELKDPNWNTVVQRPANQKDAYRLKKLATQ